ncbi:FAD-binding protein [Craterilacuibacter sp. RT1T]|uniref:FAD-binding protein n=1 Tax=Craterilacuibacter sp. RT1T TaxID=2942211 RepID=UPI0020BF6D5B|nr:FAD-binding protein [Craterilacuibacter sp. RT1T]MCL6263286.1 FAD-dependent oxidoreductase [Craterilacuibacter sp. RT1T]
MKQEFDVVVVGSGAGAMLAAIKAHDEGLSVAVIEKSECYGGTSAISGGGIWIPLNRQIEDDREQVLGYVRAAAQGLVDDKRLVAYVDTAHQMVDYLHRATRIRYAACHLYPDYYPELDGSRAGGRTMDPELFDGALLGKELDQLRPASPATLLMGKVSMTARAAHKMLTKEKGWKLVFGTLMLKYMLDFRARRKLGRKTDRRLALGNALVAGLRHGLMTRQIPLYLNTPLKALQFDGARVVGVTAEQGGKALELGARRGVILAAGGFERNQALRDQYLPQPNSAAWGVTPPNNTGDALLAGQALGAKTDLMDWAWWVPSVGVPKEASQRGLFAERSLPGCIAVDGAGQRFVDEAKPYLEFVTAMYARHRENGRCVPAWLIFDADFRYKYPMGPLMPGQVAPDRKSWLNAVYWKADTLPQLAQQIGVDSDGLLATVARVNEDAISGTDRDYGKGSNVFDRYYGDVNVKPNPCLAPIAKGPFYAMKLDAGDIGTKGGLLTDEHARVLHEGGEPIAGLYAIGNTSASVMGPSYPGAGSTLGPAMTFGYRAALHIAATDVTVTAPVREVAVC